MLTDMNSFVNYLNLIGIYKNVTIFCRKRFLFYRKSCTIGNKRCRFCEQEGIHMFTAIFVVVVALMGASVYGIDHMVAQKAEKR